MTPEQIRDYETLLDMFSHPGWKLLEKDFEEKIDHLKEGMSNFTVENTEKLYAFGQGRVSVLRDLMSWPNLIRSALEDKNEQETPV